MAIKRKERTQRATVQMVSRETLVMNSLACSAILMAATALLVLAKTSA